MNTINTITPAEAELSLRVISGPVGSIDDTWQHISYVVAVDHAGQEVWKGNYHIGVGHVDPKKAGNAWNGFQASKLTESERAMLHAWQTRPGVKFSDPLNQAKLAAKLAKMQSVTPQLEDVCHSLLSDGAAHFDSLTFEEWASDLGYDTDSRKAEKTFTACVEIGRAFARSISREKLECLREWACNY